MNHHSDKAGSVFEEIINLTKEYLPPEKLRDLIVLLDRMDTESKREILVYAAAHAP